MIEIPKQLQNENFRFCLLGKWNLWRNKKTKEEREFNINSQEEYKKLKKEWDDLGKSPFEKDWQNINNYIFNDEKLLEHKENYGVISGYGDLGIFDIDDIKIKELIEKYFPDTFTILTGSKKYHYYFEYDNLENKDLNKNSIHWLEVRAKKRMVVCPNSIHPNGNKYEIYKDIPIAKITFKQFNDFYNQFQNEFDKEYNKLGDLLKKNNKLKDLFNGKDLEFPSRSEADLSFVSILKSNGFTKEQTLEIIRRSKRNKFEEKENYPQYFDNIWEKAYFIENSIKELFRKNIKAGRALIVETLLNKYKFLTLDDNQVIYVYENGIYKNIAIALISKETQEILGNDLNSIGNVNEIIAHVKRQTYIKREDFKEPLHLICLENGIFNVDTMELEEYNPDYIFLNKVPIKYDKNAECPKIKKFLSEIIYPEDVITFQEFAGYFLYKKMIFHKSIMFVGEGANGKSTLIGLLKRFLGHENVASEPLQRLEEDRFAVAELFGKLANLVDELPKKSLKETSKFKQLTGGDSMTAQFKFKNPFKLENYAKQIFAANQLPQIDDDTYAFWRRWIIFKFEKKFDEKTADVNLLSKLCIEEELSGLFNWTVEGLKRLLKQEEFTLNKSTSEIKDNWIRESDSIGAFCLDVIEETEQTEYIAKSELYEIYCDYCRDRGYEIIVENYFHRRLLSKIKIYDKQLTIGKKHPHAWKGIRIKEKYNKEHDIKIVRGYRYNENEEGR